MNAIRKSTPKRSPAPGDGWRTGIWIVVCLILFVEVLFCTWCRIQYIKVDYAVTQAAEDNMALRARQKNLRIELASLKTPERIARIAREKLNLAAPDVDRMVTIHP